MFVIQLMKRRLYFGFVHLAFLPMMDEHAKMKQFTLVTCNI